MAIYRALTRVSCGGRIIERGGTIRAAELSPTSIPILLEKGRIASVNPPPLAQSDALADVAAELEARGLLDLGQVADADDAALDGLNADEIREKARREMEPPDRPGWYRRPPPEDCDGCDEKRRKRAAQVS